MDDRNFSSCQLDREYKMVGNPNSGFTISGKIHVLSHNFENGNMTCETTYQLPELKLSPENSKVPLKIINKVGGAEMEIFQSFQESMTTLNTNVFKLLRMQVPYNKELVNFELLLTKQT